MYQGKSGKLILFFLLAVIALSPALYAQNYQPGLTVATYDITGYSAQHPTTHNEYDALVNTYAIPSRLFGEGIANTIDGSGNPFGANDYYLTIFNGSIRIDSPGNYTFAVDGDDAVEVMVDGTVVAGWYGGHGRCNCTTHNGSIALTAGYHTLVFRQQEWVGGDNYYLYWQGPGNGNFEIVPASVLFHEAPPNPIAFYKMDDCDWGDPGTVTDSSGNSYNGDPENGISQSAQGKICKGAAFDGTDDYIQLSGLPLDTGNGAETSVAFWMYWDGKNSVMPIGFDHFDLWIANGHFGFNTSNSDIYGISSSGLSGGWHFVVAIFHNGNVHQCKLFIDGTEQALSQLQSSPANNLAYVTGSPRIGTWSSSNGYFFRGQIDEMGFYPDALTETQVNLLMNQTHGCHLCCGNQVAGLIQSTYDISGYSAHYPGNHGDYDDLVNQYGDAAHEFGSGIADTVDGTGNPYGENDYYLTVFSGAITVDTTGLYRFAVDGDDAVEVIIDGTVVAGWYGGHGQCNCTTHSGSIQLDKGCHSLVFRQQDWTGGDSYHLYWQPPGASGFSLVPPDVLSHDAPPPEVAFYQMDDCGWGGSGSIADSSGNGHDATPENGVSQTNDGKLCKAALLNANGNYIQLNGLSLNTAAGAETTVTFWMFWDGTNSVMPIGFYEFDLWLTGGNFGFNTGNGDLYGTSSAGLAGSWHHVAAIFHNGNVHQCQLWIDGVEESLSQIQGSPSNSRAFVNSTPRIGTWTVTNGYYFGGRIDEVGFYGGALTGEQIRSVMSRQHGCPMCCYHFQQKLVQTTYDISGYNLHYPGNHGDYEDLVNQYGDAAHEFGSDLADTIDGTGNPFGANDYYLTVFDGAIKVDSDGTYGFAVDGDDAVEVMIDGTVVAGWYGGHGQCNCTTHSGSITLTAGYHSLVFRQQDWTGGDSYHLYWQPPGAGSFEIVPASVLFSCQPDDMLLHYDFEESGSTALDSSTGGSVQDNGTLTSSVSRTAGICGNGIYVNGGSDSYVSTSNSADVNMSGRDAFSVAVWVRPSGTQGNNDIIWNKEGQYEVAFVNGNQLEWALTTSDHPNWYWVHSSLSLNVNQWNFIVFTYDGNAVRLYVNGSNQTQQWAYTGTVTDRTGYENSELRLGNRSSGNYPMTGWLDEFRLWGKTLSTAEIDDLFTTTPCNAEADWHFDECSWSGTAGEVRDSSGHNHNGTARGSANTADGGVLCRAAVLNLSGNSDYISLDPGALNGATDFTFLTWFKTTRNSQSHLISGANSSSDNEFLVYLNDSSHISTYLHGSGVSYTLPYSIADDNWHFFAWTLSGSDETVYLDGTAVGTHTRSSASAIQIGAGGLMVGQEQDCVGGCFDSSQLFSGSLDEMMIYHKALDSGQLAAIMSRTRADCPSCDPLVYYPMNENSGSVLNDEAEGDSISDTATLTNSVSWADGICESGIYVDGTSNSYAAADDSDETDLDGKSEMTAIIWVKPDGNQGEGDIIWNKEGQYELAFRNGYSLKWALTTTDHSSWYWVSSNLTADPNQWNMLAFTYDGNRVRLYVNGSTNYQEWAYTGTIANQSAYANSQLKLGNRSCCDFPMKGWLDEFQLWGRALTAGEIQRIFENTPCNAQAKYNFDECRWDGTTGEVRDSSFNHFNGTAKNGAQTTGTGHICRSGSFNLSDTDDYVALDNRALDNVTGFAFSGWYQTANTQQQALLSASNSTQDNEILLFQTNGTHLSVYIHGSSQGFNLPGPLNDGNWHQIAVSFDGSEISLYMDGQFVNSRPLAYTNPLRVDPGGLIVGQEQDCVGGCFDSGQAFIGQIDELRFFNHPLNATKIANLFNETHPCSVTCIEALDSQFECDPVRFRITSPAPVIEVSTSTGIGSWSIVSGNGTLTNQGNGIADYSFSVSDGGNIVLQVTTDYQTPFYVSVFDGSSTVHSRTVIPAAQYPKHDFNTPESGWSPQTNDLQDNRWDDAGRDAFDNFGYPEICIAGNCVNIDMNGTDNALQNASGAATSVSTYSVNGVNVEVTVEFADTNHNAYRIVARPGSNYAGQEITIRMHGNLGSDAGTFQGNRTLNVNGNDYTYTVTNDESNVDNGTSGNPQIRYFGFSGNESFTRTNDDNVSYSVSGTLPQALYLFVGDLGQSSFEDWLTTEISSYGGFNCGGNLYFVIEHDGSGTCCTPERIHLKIMGSGGAVQTGYAGTVTLTTSTGHGDWLTSCSTCSNDDPATGTLENGNADDGSASYAFAAGDAGEVTLFLRDTHPETLTVRADDGTVNSDGHNGGPLTFSPDSFVIETISSQISGRPFQATVSAVGLDPDTGQCQLLDYDGTVPVDFKIVYDNPATGSTPLIVNGTSVGTGWTSVNLDFTQGSATLSLIYEDAGRIFFRVEDHSDTSISGDSNLFVVKPFAFDIQANGNPGATDASGPVYKKAGENFPLSVRAVVWESGDDSDNDGLPDSGVNLSNNSETPNYTAPANLSVVVTAPSGGNNGTLSIGTVNLVSGENNSDVGYSEVGIIKISAETPDYLGAGTVRGTSTPIGRFTPAFFSIESLNQIPACSGTFTYAEQYFSVSGTIVARNTTNGITTNYRDNFAKLTAAGISATPTGGTGALSFVAPTPIFTNGQSPFTATGNRYGWGSPTNPETIQIQLNTSDSDGISGNATSNGVQYRYGRLNILNNFGPSDRDLQLTVRAEYYQDGIYHLSTEDSCTGYTISDISLLNWQNNLNPGDTAITNLQTISGGTGSLTLGAPGLGNEGAVELRLTAPAYMNFKDGIATFGVYRGDDRIISWQEIQK